jgi:hypothetical protein
VSRVLDSVGIPADSGQVFVLDARHACQQVALSLRPRYHVAHNPHVCLDCDSVCRGVEQRHLQHGHTPTAAQRQSSRHGKRRQRGGC